MKSWKTTACGILAAVAAGITLVVIPLLDNNPATTANWGAFGASLAAAVGLVLARDDDKTSEDVGAK
ncbi:MAG: hypothetical protein V1809_01940 [Planctomycetota bacterium]